MAAECRSLGQALGAEGALPTLNRIDFWRISETTEVWLDT